MPKRKKTLADLFHSLLQDAYSAETQLVDALPEMAEAAESADLRAAFEQHLAETKGHVAKLERVCAEVGCGTGSNTCEAMEGLIAEGDEVMGLMLAPEALDAGLIAAAQKVEHYEIAQYGTLRTFARQLGHDSAAELLDGILDEEQAADEALTQLAEARINEKAAA